MKYRITIEKLVEPGVNDPVGHAMSYDTWKMAYFQSFDNDKVDEVTAAVALAVNEAINK